jgi:hypothetical protein
MWWNIEFGQRAHLEGVDEIKTMRTAGSRAYIERAQRFRVETRPAGASLLLTDPLVSIDFVYTLLAANPPVEPGESGGR